MNRPRLQLATDVVVHNGIRYEQKGAALLYTYLTRDPQRIRDVIRLVPEAVNGIRAVVRVEDGLLLVTSVEVKGIEDPLCDMVLWHALFPGLRAPLVAWWFTGQIYPVPRRVLMTSTLPIVMVEPERDPGVLWSIEQGHVRPSPPLLDSVTAELQQWPFNQPFVVRALILAVFLLAVPIATVMVYRDGRKERYHGVPWWYALTVPVLTLGMVLKMLAPGLFGRHIEPLFDHIGRRYRQGQIVQEMVDNALESDAPRSIPK